MGLTKADRELLKACEVGRWEAIEIAISKGADINCRNGEESPVVVALWGGHIEAAERLLSLPGVDIDASGKSGRTAIVAAANLQVFSTKDKERARELMHTLAERGANLNQISGSWSLLGTVLFNQMPTGDIAKLLERGALPTPEALRNAWLRQPLGPNIPPFDKSSIVRLFLEHGFASSQKGALEDALHWAASEGDSTSASLLIDSGADIDAPGENSRTPLMEAVRPLSIEIADIWRLCGKTIELLLARGADVSAVDSDGETALHKAVFADNADAAKLLLKKGADVEARNHGKETPFVKSGVLGHLKTAKVLFEAGADISARDANGWTALDIALKQLEPLKLKPGDLEGIDDDELRADILYGEDNLDEKNYRRFIAWLREIGVPDSGRTKEIVPGTKARAASGKARDSISKGSASSTAKRPAGSKKRVVSRKA